MGVVYEAFDREREHLVALKTLQASQGDALYRFKHEFRAIAELSHPNLVALYDLFVEDDGAFFTMELIDGVNFVSWCRPRGGEGVDEEGPTEMRFDAPTIPVADSPPLAAPLFDEERVRPALAQLLRGLHALHASGRVHRDIKDTNVLVNGDGRVVVLDFGLVTVGAIGQTQQHIVGTLEFMAPEQANPLGPVRPAADIYSAGIMLYEVLTGSTPFNGSATDILLAKSELDPPPPGRGNPAIPEDLSKLCHDMIQRDPSRRPSAQRLLKRMGEEEEPEPRQSGSLPVTRDGIFSGRAAELATLDSAFEAVRNGQPAVVRLRGRSGIGKTELFRQFVRRQRARADGLVALQGRCYERESIRYRGIDPLIDELTRTWTELPVDLAQAMTPPFPAALLLIFPVLSRVRFLIEAEEFLSIVDPNELRRRAFDGLGHILRQLAAARPLVMFLDDLQWVDRDTVLLLADLMRMPDAPPLMLILAGRDDSSVAPNPDLESLFEALELEVREIDVGPLSTIESIELAKRLLEPHRSSLAPLVARESTGHPLFLVELAAFINGGGDDRGDSIHQIRLKDVIAMRLGDLPAVERLVLNTVALVGEPIQRSVIRTAVQVDSEPFARALMKLQSERLLRTGGNDADGLVECYHDRICETVVSQIEDTDRTIMHRNLALALERVQGEEASGKLARHWRAAGEPTRAMAYALTAARQAFDQLDFDRSVELYRQALSLGTMPAGEVRAVQGVIATALANAGRAHESARAFQLAADGEPRARRLDLQRRAAEQLLRGGHLEEGLNAFEPLLREVGLAMPASRRRALWSILGLLAKRRLRGFRFRPRDASEAPEESSEEALLVDFCWSLAVSLIPVDPVAGTLFHLRGLLAAMAYGERRRLGRALAVDSFLASLENRPRALLSLDRARTVGQDDVYVASYCVLAELGRAYFVDCDWARVIERFDELRGMLITQRTSSSWELDASHNFYVFALMYRGEFSTLNRTLRDVSLEEARRRVRLVVTSLRGRMAIDWLARDDPDSASREQIEIVSEIPSWRHGFTVTHFYCLHSRCEIELYRGNAALARERFEQSYDALRTSMILRSPVLAAEAWFLSARIALAEGDLRRARADSIRLMRVAYPLAGPLGTLVRAGLAAHGGNRAAAEASLRAAISELESTETLLYVAPAKHRLGQLVGGTEGEILCTEAETAFTERGVTAPAKLFDLLLPWPDKSG